MKTVMMQSQLIQMNVFFHEQIHINWTLYLFLKYLYTLSNNIKPILDNAKSRNHYCVFCANSIKPILNAMDRTHSLKGKNTQ